MKKTLLLMAVAMTAFAQQSVAQDEAMFENIGLINGGLFSKCSEDGRYFVMQDEGSIIVYDNETEEIYYHEGEVDLDGNYTPYYSVGFGNIFAADGTMVGCYDDWSPAYLKDGEWTLLPISEEAARPGNFNSADAITLDGSRICGGIAVASFGIDAKDAFMVPVIWDRQADGTYGEPKLLPHPTTDFTGRTPQYVTARCISDDGKTIVGQITDWSGSFIMPVVYKEDANGEWSYKVLATDMVYNKDAVFPKWPDYEPKSPEGSDYMSEENAAAYQEAVNAYWYGERDDYPNMADYMTPENAEAYNAAVEIYNNEATAYNDSCDLFYEVFWDPEMVYNTSFVFNTIAMTRDGHYCGVTFSYADDSDPDAWFPAFVQKPYRIDLTSEDYTGEMSDNESGLVTCFVNDGSMLFASPADDYTRNTYVMPVGQTESVALIDYIQTVSPNDAEALAMILTFQAMEYDEEWNPVPGEEAVWTGTACCNGAGNVFFGWLVNNFYGVEEWYYLTWILDVKNVVSLSDIKSQQVASAIVTDIEGRVVNTTGSLKGLGKGVFMVTATMADGSTKTKKVICK